MGKAVRSRLPPAWPAGLIAAALLAACLPLLVQDFGYWDDYAYLFFDGNRARNPYAIGHGRPLAGLLNSLLFSTAETIADIKWLRLLAVLQLALVAGLVGHAVHRAAGPLAALVAGGVLIASAPVRLYAFWAVFSGQLPGLLIATLLGLWRSRLEASAGGRLLFVALLVCAHLFYQPFAGFVWPVLLIAWLAETDARRLARSAWRAAVDATAAMLAFVLLFKATMALLPDSVANRGTMVGLADLPDKLAWFLGERLPLFLSLGEAGMAVPMTLGIAAVALLGLAHGGAAMRLVLARGAVFALALVFSYAANLGSAENADDFRTILAPLACVAVAFAFGAAMLAERLPRRAGLVLGVAVVALAAGRAWTSFAALIPPQRAELAAVRQAVAALPAAPCDTLLVIGTPFGQGCQGELGCRNGSVHFAAIPLVELVLREQGRQAGTVLFVEAKDPSRGVLMTTHKTAILPLPADACRVGPW